MSKPIEINDEWIDRIKNLVNGLQFGSLQIVVHDGKIVQIDRLERHRFDQNTALPDAKEASKVRRTR